MIESNINYFTRSSCTVYNYSWVKMADSLLSLGTWIIVGFAITPYIYLLYLTKNATHHASLIVIIVLSIKTGIFGIWALLDSMFILMHREGWSLL